MTAFLRLAPMHPERAIEWLIGSAGLLWGGIVLAFPRMFETQPLLYKGMLTLLPQPLWGMIAFAASLLRLGALYVNGQHFRTPTVRVITSFISMLIWFLVVVGLMRQGVPNTGWAIYPVLMLGDLWSVYRASGDAYTSNSLHRKIKVINGGMSGVGNSGR